MYTEIQTISPAGNCPLLCSGPPSMAGPLPPAGLPASPGILTKVVPPLLAAGGCATPPESRPLNRAAAPDMASPAPAAPRAPPAPLALEKGTMVLIYGTQFFSHIYHKYLMESRVILTGWPKARSSIQFRITMSDYKSIFTFEKLWLVRTFKFCI